LAAVVAVPSLAVAFLGGNLFTGSILPGSAPVSETRDFYYSGQKLTLPAAPAGEAQPTDQFLGNWQNTVRIPPSPRV
jgi:hypothetical protein